MNAWDVYEVIEDIEQTRIDTVFFVENMDARDVYNSLVNHDGYSQDIVVRNAQIEKLLEYNTLHSIEDLSYYSNIDLQWLEDNYEYPKNRLLF